MIRMISPVAIIGAGISGLAAYRTLRNSRIRALVFEKSRGCGGRAATRRMEGIIADLGAQFMAASREDLKQLLRAQGERVVTAPGVHGSGDHPRYVHREGMSALVKSLVADLNSAPDLLFQSRLQEIRQLRESSESKPIWALA